MGFRLNRPVRGAMLRRRGFWFSYGGGLRRGWRRASLIFTDQGHQVGLKPCAVFCGMAQQDLDQTAFACAEMSLNTPAGKTVQECDRLLSQQLFEFLGCHVNPVIRET
jgi:hypothetical protein